MASIAMLLGGAIANAVAFTRSSYLFSKLSGSDVEDERRRHNAAIEQLQAAQAAWAKKRTQRLDFIQEQLRREGHAVQTFKDVDEAVQEYYLVTGKRLDPLTEEPQLTDFYTPSGSQQAREIQFIVLALAAAGVTGYYIEKSLK
jgi:hypothetical protein